MAEINEDTAAGVLVFSGLTGISGGLLSLVFLPWYAAIGAGIGLSLVTFFLWALLFSVEV